MVYNALMEIFPKVDRRALRAVAVEHGEDVDAAVVAVLQEVIPFFVEVERQKSDDSCSTWSSEASECALVRQDVGMSSMNDKHHEDLYESQLVMPKNLYENKMEFSAAMHSPGESVVLMEKIKMGAVEEVDASVDQEVDLVQRSGGTASNEENVSVNAFEAENSLSDGKSTSQAPNIREDDLDYILDDPNTAEIQAIDVLEEIIAHAKHSKETLSSALESVHVLIQEVEQKQEAAEKAKEEAAKGGAHILNKVEDLKRMLQHAKEANEMHSGEVYGEKAILASELKEVQNRVFFLLDEKDQSLGSLDEMRQRLEGRLAVALDIIKSAEKEKEEKEIAAQKLYAGQELVMEKVVHESKILKQQAEENSKLQEFLWDRGCVLDKLHGEMAVICQDVKLLKEKFDNGDPLSKSLYSSHSSSFLSSSTSLSKKPSIQDEAEPVLNRDDSISAFLTEEWRDPDDDARLERMVDDWDFLD